MCVMCVANVRWINESENEEEGKAKMRKCLF
jgi:hypothetical protein